MLSILFLSSCVFFGLYMDSSNRYGIATELGPKLGYGIEISLGTVGILMNLLKIEKNFKSQHEHEYKGKHTVASLERELQVDEININS